MSSVFSEISRSDVIGDSYELEYAGMDYFGDIVAGSVKRGKQKQQGEAEVTCMYLS
jgi:hypothetical protein